MSLAVQSVEKWEFHGLEGKLKHQGVSRPWRTDTDEKCITDPSDDAPCTVAAPSSPTEIGKHDTGKKTVSATRRPQKSVRKDKIAFVLGVLHFW